MTYLDIIQTVFEQAVPNYNFFFEAKKMMNVKADDALFPAVYFEEYTTGKIFNRYGLKRSRQCELSFMMLADLDADAAVRERQREQMEEEAVIPFITALNASGLVEEVTEFDILPEPPVFDANATCLLLRFNCTKRLCK